MKRVIVESPTLGLEHIFKKEDGFESVVVTPGSTLPDGDILALSGGADIHPELYAQREIPETHPSKMRDKFSIKLRAHYKELPKVGICRGAQFLCAANGGTLWQDISDHEGGYHPITLKDGRTVTVNTVHHQACRPLRSWIHIARSTYPAHYVKDDRTKLSISKGTILLTKDTEDFFIHEAFYIPSDKALCVQWHPEFGHKMSHDLFFQLMKEYIR